MRSDQRAIKGGKTAIGICFAVFHLGVCRLVGCPGDGRAVCRNTCCRDIDDGGRGGVGDNVIHRHRHYRRIGVFRRGIRIIGSDSDRMRGIVGKDGGIPEVGEADVAAGVVGTAGTRAIGVEDIIPQSAVGGVGFEDAVDVYTSTRLMAVSDWVMLSMAQPLMLKTLETMALAEGPSREREGGREEEMLWV
jgi:hypothetical protein